MKLIKEFCNVTSNKDRITFSLRSHDPLCVAMIFKKLDNAHMVYYLAPRKDLDIEDEFEDNFEPTETEETEFEDNFEPIDNEDDQD